MADEFAGRQGKCKQCGEAITVPRPPSRQPSSTSASSASSLEPPSTARLAHPPPTGGRPSVRRRRLTAEARQMQAAFQAFPLIQIRGASGNPPEIYQIQYNIRGLARGPGGRPVVRDQHIVQIQLTREYPRQSPKCKMLTPVFHPNIEPAMICVGDHWTASERLVDLVVRIGEMIAFQAFNIKSPLDGEAAMWADMNSAHLPVDPRCLHPGEW
jgi:ubiquitin-protein ligase